MPPANCCHIFLEPLAKNVNSGAAGSIWAMDVPGWISAIAAVGLLVGAIITARYAIKAFRAQSDQLADERKVNKQQTEVLALQAEELRESLAERRREAVERRNAQEAQVPIALKVVAKSREGGPEIEATVVNASERQQPIYDVQLYWYRGQEGYGTPNLQLLGTVLNWEKEPRRWEFPRGADPAECGAFLAFSDAFGVNWIKTPGGAAMHAESELLPDLERALSGKSGNGASPT
jgi:hypothetical protein